MGLLNIFKKSKDREKQEEPVVAPDSVVHVENKKKEIADQPEVVVKKNIPISKSIEKANKILLKPWVTEKSNIGQTLNKYSFAVDPHANKIMVALAIKELYGVKPIKVNLVKVRGKNVRYGRTSGKTQDWRKAVVTLKPGDKINLFEGV